MDFQQYFLRLFPAANHSAAARFHPNVAVFDFHNPLLHAPDDHAENFAR
jgi:hypothetical protein